MLSLLPPDRWALSARFNKDPSKEQGWIVAGLSDVEVDSTADHITDTYTWDCLLLSYHYWLPRSYTFLILYQQGNIYSRFRICKIPARDLGYSNINLPDRMTTVPEDLREMFAL